jgi:hypothetical protein
MGKAVAIKGKTVNIRERDEEIWRLRREGVRFSKKGNHEVGGRESREANR